MGNNPSVSSQTEVASPTAAVPYLNHALLTFFPENTTFATNFAASTQDWMFRDPNTLEGLVAELTPANWATRLASLACPTTDPVYTAVDAFFNQLALTRPDGTRETLRRPDKIYIGRRTSAVQSVNTFTFATNTAGRVIITINQARWLYSGSSPAGALAQITVIADGVDTVTQLADDAVAQLNALTDFSAHFLAANVAGEVTVTSDRAGYPLIISIRSSTGGPTMTQAVTTGDIAGAYDADLTEMQNAAELGADVDPPSRKYYWITDLQGDDEVNAEGMEWCENEEDDNTPARDYQFFSWSTTGARTITFGGNQIGNFNPSATASASQEAQDANGGTGWTRGGVWDHDRYEFFAAAMLGRCIGYLPGEVSFTSKVLYGSTDAAKMAGRDFGTNETLTNGDERSFNWYSAEGPFGSAHWGYLADGSFVDRKWIEDYVDYFVRTDLVQWMQLNNITTYTNADILAGKAVIADAIGKVPAVVKDSIGVVSLTRDQVNPANIVARVYYDYTGSGQSAGVINKIGTPDTPIPIVITDGP